MDHLGEISVIVLYGAMVLYAIAMIAFAIDIARRPSAGVRKAANIGMSTTAFGTVLHVIAVLARALAAGRVPWANMYEFTITFTAVAMVVFFVVQRWRDLRSLGIIIVPPVLLALLAAAILFYVKAEGVQPILNHYWLVIHVANAIAATGVLTVAAGLAILQLLKDRQERRENAETSTLARVLANVPGADDLERFAFRLNALGFVLWTFLLVSGAIWAEHAWGRPWGWDPKETWSFVVWVVYAAYMHARLTRGWDGRRAATLTLIAYACLLANFYLVNLLADSKHSYADIPSSDSAPITQLEDSPPRLGCRASARARACPVSSEGRIYRGNYSSHRRIYPGNPLFSLPFPDWLASVSANRIPDH